MPEFKCKNCKTEYDINTFVAQTPCPCCGYRVIANYNAISQRFEEREYSSQIVVTSGSARPPSATSGAYVLSFTTHSGKPRCERCGTEEVLTGHKYCGKCSNTLNIKDA